MSASVFDSEAAIGQRRVVIRRNGGDLEMVELPWGLQPREPGVPALGDAGVAEQLADAVGSDLTAGDHSIIGNDTAAAPSLCRAYDCVMERDALEGHLGRDTTGLVQFRRVEIREPNFDPVLGIGRLTDAKAVSITNISDDSGKADAGMAWQWRLAWVGMYGSNGAEQSKGADNGDDATVHAACFNVSLALFFLSSVRTNLSHLAMPARFSTI